MSPSLCGGDTTLQKKSQIELPSQVGKGLGGESTSCGTIFQSPSSSPFFLVDAMESSTFFAVATGHITVGVLLFLSFFFPTQFC